ncbi:MAG: glycosyltransferase [Nitrososphaerota archaeon]
MVRPQLSIVIPAYNREWTIGDAIESVISQDLEDYEIIVVDNGSTDKTVKIVKQYMKKDERIKLHIYDRKRGEYPPTNFGIMQARGEIIGILHSDDMYVPGTLSFVAEQFQRYDKPTIFYPSTKVVKQEGGHLIHLSDVHWFDRLDIKNMANKSPDPAVFFHKKVYEIVGPIDESYKYYGFRKWHLMSFLKRGINRYASSKICYIYRIHSKQQTSTATVDKLRKELTRLYYEFYIMLKNSRSMDISEDIEELRWYFKKKALDEARALIRIALKDRKPVTLIEGLARFIATYIN